MILPLSQVLEMSIRPLSSFMWTPVPYRESRGFFTLRKRSLSANSGKQQTIEKLSFLKRWSNAYYFKRYPHETPKEKGFCLPSWCHRQHWLPRRANFPNGFIWWITMLTSIVYPFLMFPDGTALPERFDRFNALIDFFSQWLSGHAQESEKIYDFNQEIIHLGHGAGQRRKLLYRRPDRPDRLFYGEEAFVQLLFLFSHLEIMLFHNYSNLLFVIIMETLNTTLIGGIIP